MLQGRKQTIWECLAKKLGREPTHKEACEEVKRILQDSTVDLATRGKLRFQKKRH
jgi:acyl-CoA hydrolase